MTSRTSPNRFERPVGSTKPFLFPIGEAVADYTFTMSANSRIDASDPPSNIFDIVGVPDVNDPFTVIFTPTTQQASPSPGLYYFQVLRVRISDGAEDFPADGTLTVTPRIPA